MNVIFESREGVRMATLPAEDYERLVSLAEDRADVRAAADAEARRLAGEEYLPSEFVDRLLAGESPLRLWREHRQRTVSDLAAVIGIGRSYLSEIERGLKPGTPKLWRRLADALKVDLDDIMPEAD
jgi:DNA-binding XRE family transcriptional regulator